MVIGALGDIHGDYPSVRDIQRSEPDVAVWLSVGDLADAAGAYGEVASPIHWIKGNNENFDTVDARRLPPGLEYLPNATVREIAGLRVCGLGGTFAPSVFALAARDLPHPAKRTPAATALADRRRHFVQEEVEACGRIHDVDILLTHEAARPYRVGRVDAGKTPINEVLVATAPRLHLFGHHHRFSEQIRQGVRSVGLDLVARSYLVIDTKSLEYAVRQR